MIPENAQQMALLPRFTSWLLGEHFTSWLFGGRAARLTERTSRAHWLSYLLIISQSIAVVLVFGHAEVPLLLSTNVAILALAVMVLFVLIITVIAADIALLETLRRIPALARNRQRWQMYEHVLYVLFVLATEGGTYAVVLMATDSDPQVLVRSAPLIPTTGLFFVGLVVLRVLLICWSAVQLIIVRAKLPVLLSTLTNTGKEIMGAHVEKQLADLDIGDIALTDTFRVYAEMARPPRSIPTLFNGWRIKRELAAEAEEERQVRNVVNALEELKKHRVQTTTSDEPPTPPRGGGRAPAPAAPIASLNPRAAQDVRTAAESVAEAIPAASSLYVVKDAPKGRRRNQPGRRTAKGKRDTSSVEDLARAVWRPGMSVSDVMAETAAINHGKGISRGAASKYINKFEAAQTSAESA